MMNPPAYRLWSGSRGGWCDYELDIKNLAAMRALYPADWDGRSLQLDLEFQILPEPRGPHGREAISVRTNDAAVGYVTDLAWLPAINRIVASGFIPTTNGQIWARETDWDEIEFDGTVRLNLGSAAVAIPSNDPPEEPYTLLPRGGIVQVTKEEDHSDALLKHVPPGGRGALIVTLHENIPARGNAKPHVEVRIDNERVGQFTPQTSQRFLPMIRHFTSRGLLTAACGDIEGSQVAAEVRVDSIKANEADDKVLNGQPTVVPRLVTAQSSPWDYDLTGMAQHLAPKPPAPPRPTPPEPPDGSVIRFVRSRYTFIAIRRGTTWETSASGDWGPISEAMRWTDLAKRLRTFEVAAGWEPIGRHDRRLSDHLAVVHFFAGGYPMAALHINDSGYSSWYGTMTEAMEARLPFYKNSEWSDIAMNSQHHQLVTRWMRCP